MTSLTRQEMIEAVEEVVTGHPNWSSLSLATLIADAILARRAAYMRSYRRGQKAKLAP